MLKIYTGTGSTTRFISTCSFSRPPELFGILMARRIQSYPQKSSQVLNQSKQVILMLWKMLIFLLIFSTCQIGYCRNSGEYEVNSLAFNRYELTATDAIGKVKNPKNGEGIAGVDGWGITGWFEYDLKIEQAGWYELISVLSKYMSVEYIIDPNLYSKGLGGDYILATGAGFDGETDKISNIWLDAGEHSLRLQQYYWTGFPPIKSIILRHSSDRISGRTRVSIPVPSRVYKANGCPKMDLQYSSLARAEHMTVQIMDADTGIIRDRYTADLPHTSSPQKIQLPLFCSKEGSYRVSFGDALRRPVNKRDIGDITYQVIDPSLVKNDTGELARKLVQEIDVAKVAPDFVEGGETRVVNRSFGSYRESGNNNWEHYHLLDPAARANYPKPSWFAYKLKIEEYAQPYMVEVDYPDDKLRSFAIAIRESVAGKLPVAGGVDSGGEFELSNTLQTSTLIFWPRARDGRIVFMNARAGGRAAAAKVRVYRLGNTFPALIASPSKGGRIFANWYEEGGNFTGLYGVDDSPEASRTAIDRWAQSLRYMGGNVLFPTVNVYNFQFYPSRFNLAFGGRNSDDKLRRMLLIAEKYGLKVLPDMHPRADELAWPYKNYPDPKPNLLVSKDGMTLKNVPPYYNPIYPANQDWYVGMIGELADNYKDSPALMGVSLRLMQWANPTLSNFQSLDWGYDDFTVGLFQKETGIRIPADANDSSRFNRRYNWIMENEKEKWIEWRCRKIAQLYTKIRDRVRQARPDLKVYLPVFDAYPSVYGTGWLRETGIDPKLLLKIDGVELINSLHAYGRRYDKFTTQGTRDNILDPDVLKALIAPGGSGRFNSYARYFEATEVVVPPESLGFGSETKKAWTSAVLNPSGRNYLERYAVPLAETDSVWLGDGGNGYTLGQPLLREFLSEYRMLPAESFIPRPDARDPVAVWELGMANEYYFYVVNKERFSVTTQIVLQGNDSVTRLSSGRKVDVENGTMDVQLKPFQLLTYKTSGATRIAKVSVKYAEKYQEHVTKQVDWLEMLADDINNARGGLSVSTAQKDYLGRYCAEARSALENGWIWKARTIIENHELLSLYNQLDKYPPWLGNDASASE